MTPITGKRDKSNLRMLATSYITVVTVHTQNLHQDSVLSTGMKKAPVQTN